MPIDPPPPDSLNSISVSALELIAAALQEIGALAPGEEPSPGDGGWVLRKLQRLIDRYNARQPMIYNVSFTKYTLQANHSPHTIGPDADFDCIQRPVDIPSVGLLLTNSNPPVEILLNPRDEAWWAAQSVKNLTSTIPTDYYYSPDWPVGQIFFWPIATQVNDVLIQARTILKEITNYNQKFSLPPGYWDAIVYPLAVSLCPSYERAASRELLLLETKAIKAIQTNNIASPRGTTADAGMPGTRTHGDFNYYTGRPN